MERTMSSDERIRRAEEIYNRRKMQNGVRGSTARVTKSAKDKYRLYKKLILQITTCFFIYFIFYLIKNSNYIFSQDFIGKTKEFLSYDINFGNAYNSVVEYYNNNIKTYFEKINNEEIVDANDDNQMTNEIEENNGNNLSEENEAGIGGGEDENITVVDTATQTTSEPTVQLSQMEIDANQIKANHSITLPLVGIVSSRYGPRQGSSIVSSDHKGIDIAANEGTVFTAAMSGTVIVASKEGSYGNHLFIQEGNVITVYAHCKKLYVKQGDEIKQGQKLGEVGQTGNATGPHLHFEIRIDNRTVNPELILSFA